MNARPPSSPSPSAPSELNPKPETKSLNTKTHKTPKRPNCYDLEFCLPLFLLCCAVLSMRSIPFENEMRRGKFFVRIYIEKAEKAGLMISIFFFFFSLSFDFFPSRFSGHEL